MPGFQGSIVFGISEPNLRSGRVTAKRCPVWPRPQGQHGTPACLVGTEGDWTSYSDRCRSSPKFASHSASYIVNGPASVSPATRTDLSTSRAQWQQDSSGSPPRSGGEAREAAQTAVALCVYQAGPISARLWVVCDDAEARLCCCPVERRDISSRPQARPRRWP